MNRSGDLARIGIASLPPVSERSGCSKNPNHGAVPQQQKRNGGRGGGKGKWKMPPSLARKQQAAMENVDQVTGAKIPKSFVFSRGKLPSTLRHLQQDLRKLMLPYTALNLKEKKRNNLKDFVNVAGPLGVTHFLILSNPKSLPHLRFAKSPQGPTYTFQIEEYALAADIANSQQRPRCPPEIFKNSPLVVLSGFVGLGEPFKSLVTFFRYMVPVIDPDTVKLATCQRILLLQYDKETGVVDFRHYSIKLQPVGVSRKIRKLMQNNQVPISLFYYAPDLVLSDKLPEVLDFDKDLAHLEPASKIQLKYLAEEMQAITKGLEKVEQELATSEKDGPVSEIFYKKLKEFLADAQAQGRSLALLYSTAGKSADSLAHYFGEDPVRCPFEQVVFTLLSFVKTFGRAHSENLRQVELEKKRAQMEAEREKVKVAAQKDLLEPGISD